MKPSNISSAGPMADKLIDDCFAHDKKRLRHAEALAILRKRLQPVTDCEQVPLARAAAAQLDLARERRQFDSEREDIARSDFR